MFKFSEVTAERFSLNKALTPKSLSSNKLKETGACIYT